MDNRGDPLVGRVLDGRYRVGPRIARGGMAAVHQATDLRLDRTVAVKIMHAGLADDPDFVRRFEREARSAAKLAHPNVVAVFDQGDDDGTLFLVMEHVSGVTLRDVIRTDAPMSPARALALVDPVLSALNAAHRAGMIHRDVKPENVLLTDPHGNGGDVKVADFGLARAVNADTQSTATGGLLIGTVSYLAPELVADGRADPRADVYAVGVMLYEMLTGRKPHQADSPIQVAYKHVHEDVPPPSQVIRSLPAYVDALVARATSRDTSVRPADAGVLLHHVRRVRQALEHGVLDDPELTEDLMPSYREHTNELPDLQGSLPDQIIDPSAPGAALAYEEARGLLDDPRDQRDPRDHHDADHTVAVPLAGGAPPSGGGRGGALVAAPGRLPADDRQLYRPGRPGRRGPLLLVAIVALVLIIALGGWYFGIDRYTVTPGVVDQSSSVANAKLTKAGLHMHVQSQVFSETVPKAAVVSTSPAAGDRIRKHGTVQVVLSKGPERHQVPQVRGMSLDRAQAAIQSAHLSFGQAIQRYDDTIPQGTVVGSNPKAGTALRRNTAVNVIVSRGQKPIPIPDLTNKPDATAAHQLRKLGFTVDDSSTDYSTSVKKGDVITQSPSSGTGHKGDTITLVISKGPQLVTLPDVRRGTFADGKAQLEALGLKVTRENSPFYIGLDRIASMSPKPGSKVPLGSTVRLILV